MTKINGVLGEIWIYVGGRYSGKSTAMIKATKHVPIQRLFVNEFHGSTWTDAGRNRRKWIPDEEFIQLMLIAKDSVFVIEDATAVFVSQVTKPFMQAMARSRDEGVTILLAFHSFRKIPNDILDMIDGIVILKTRDGEENITAKTDNPEVLDKWKKVMSSAKPHAKKSVRFTIHHK